MSIYRNLEDEIRIRFDVTVPIKIPDLLELVGDSIEKDEDSFDESFDNLLADLAERGYQVDIPEDDEELHKQLGTPITTGARDSVHIWMRELAALDLLSRDQELEFSRNLNSSLSEMMAAMAVLKPISSTIKELLIEFQQRGKLHRLLEGFLDNVSTLPTVTRKTGKETTTEKKPPPFDIALAERRIKKFVRAYDQYFGVTPSRRTKKAKLALEDSLMFFKLTTNRLNEVVDPFKEYVRSHKKIYRSLEDACVKLGVKREFFKKHLAPNATRKLWEQQLKKLPKETRVLIESSPRIQRLRTEASEFEANLSLSYETLDESNKRFLAAETRRNSARDGLAEGNYRLVMSVAQKFKNRGVDHEDLIQEGNLGLLRAIEKFDYTRGFKFSTYATWWIRQAVTRALGEYSRTVRLPANVNQDIRAVSRATQQLRQDLGREPSNTEIAKRIGKTIKQVRDTKKYVLEARTLDKPVGDDEDGATFGDLLPDLNVLSPDENAEIDALRDAVNDALGRLNAREVEIVMMHHGIRRAEPMTITQISEELDVSRERVRQIYTRAITRLGRESSKSDSLKAYL